MAEIKINLNVNGYDMPLTEKEMRMILSALLTKSKAMQYPDIPAREVSVNMYLPEEMGTVQAQDYTYLESRLHWDWQKKTS